MAENTRLSKLLIWLKENDVKINPSLEVLESPLGGYGVSAKETIQAGEVIFGIPKACVLSGKSAGIGNLLDDFDIDGVNGTTLAVMFEQGQGSESPWYDYLNTLSGESIPNLPRFWSEEDKRLLKGTEVDYIGGCEDTEVRETYANVIQPFIEEHLDLFPNEDQNTYEGYCAALRVVCSRAFEVDSYLGISLVPSADLLNHSDKENAHFESTFDVCPMCGALNFCFCEPISMEEIEDAKLLGEDSTDAADDEENKDYGDISYEDDDDIVSLVDGYSDTKSDTASDDGEESEGEDECDIRAIKKIEKGEEVFNTYGDYSNSILLSKYGFAIWDNSHETIDLGREVIWYAKSQDVMPRIKWWSSNFYQCIYRVHPENYEYEMEKLAETEGGLSDDANFLPSPSEITWKETVEINYQGAASDGLGLLLSVLTASPQKFLTYKKKVAKGDFRCIAKLKEGKVLAKLVNKRLSRYEDGNMSSSDYKKLLGDMTDERKKLVAVIRGTEKLVLERALKRAHQK